MSLSIAFGIIIAEAIMAALVMIATIKPGLRVRNMVALTGFYTGVSWLFAFGTLGNEELRGVSVDAVEISSGALLTAALGIFNCAVFVTASVACERKKYGSPTSK